MSVTAEKKWTDVVRLARNLSPDIPRSARHLALVFATYAKKDGRTTVGIASLCRGMGYHMNPDGTLSKNARIAFWHTYGKLERIGLVTEREACDCPDYTHPWHWRLDVAALRANQMIVPKQIKQSLWSKSNNHCGANQTITSNTSVELHLERRVRTTPSTSRATKNVALEPRAQKTRSRHRYTSRWQPYRENRARDAEKDMAAIKAEVDQGCDADNLYEVMKAQGKTNDRGGDE